MMLKRAISSLRNSFFFRDMRGWAILWGIILAAVLYATYALHLWSARPEDEGFSFLSGSPSRGGVLFSSLGCNSCHALYGMGPQIGPDLGTSLPAGSSPVRIVADMWDHSPQMWEKMKEAQLGIPHVTEQDTLDLLAFLYIVRYMDVPGDVDNGRKVFFSKGCFHCHTLDGSKATPGPDLGQLDAETPIIWAQRMWNHGQNMEALMAQKNVAWPTFQGREMLDLLSYLQKSSSGTRHEAALLPATPSRGKTLFVEKGCSTCHSVNGEGGHQGPELGPRHEGPPSLAEFAGLMWNHSPQMWVRMKKQNIPRPQFAAREMADLIAYLYLVGYLEPAGRVDLGAQVFNEKHCSNCHGTNGHGGRGGPNLARRQPYHSAQLAYTVWSHGPQMYLHMREKNIPWPSLNESEVVNLIAFLNSL
jgi:mono/diheme cytochrome c family protein